MEQTVKYLDQRTHILRRPALYIGSTDQIPRQKDLYDLKTNTDYNDIILFPEGAEQIYLEILDNALEAVLRQKSGEIDIVIGNNDVSITNYECVLPIELYPDSGTYIPELCFGKFNVSRHYNILGNAQHIHNGIGAKATNVFSKLFTVDICDHKKQLKYSQTWTDNMANCGQPLIKKYLGDVSFVRISYEMDFEMFGYQTPGGNIYPSEALSLFAKHALDKSIRCQIPITFNGCKL